MERLYCHLCEKSFTRNDSLKRHIKTIHVHTQSDVSNNSIICHICDKRFARKSCLTRHYQTVHPYKELSDKISQLRQELNNREHKLKIELKEQISDQFKQFVQPTSTTNNHLNIICVTNNDNYLDMLTDRMGNFDRAIGYIKECALSDLVGDCKLIEKIYTDDNQQMGFSLDQRRTKITYHDEGGQLITENKELFGRKIAGNLQNSYLKGVNFLIQRSLNQKIDPNKLLNEYDLVTWNNHIYQLSNINHQQKIINNLSLTWG